MVIVIQKYFDCDNLGNKTYLISIRYTLAPEAFFEWRQLLSF